MDAGDELAWVRDLFVIGDEDRIYMDGNSLGRLPKATAGRLQASVAQWGSALVSGWSEWIDLPARVGDELGAALLGAAPGQTVVCDSTTVNLYKLASAALVARPDRPVIVADDEDFPTERYVLQGLAAAHRRELSNKVELDGSVALVCLSQVDFRTSMMRDMAALTEAAHEVGALVLWDLSHSAGAVPLALDECGVDLAVGCTYKYVNAGPGSPAFLYISAGLQAELRSPIQGWFGQSQQFEMAPDYDPAEGVTRFLAGTPSVLGMVAVEEGVRVLADAGVTRLRQKSIRLTQLLVELADDRLRPLGFEVASPREAEHRGGHVALRHPEAWPICQALNQPGGAVADFREPDLLRLGPVPAYTRFVDVYDAVDRVAQITESGTYRTYPSQRSRVT
jgi:kynureninase